MTERDRPAAAPPGGERAIVVGASIAGLLAACVLSKRFGEVLLIDRDEIPVGPEQRGTVPQEHHAHLLLQRGKMIMERFLPGFLADLEAKGAEVADLSHDVKWFHAGVWKNRWPTGIKAHYCTRTLIEHVLRRRVLALPNVRMMDRTRVEHLLIGPGGAAVTGVSITARGGAPSDIGADIVVDSSGRGSAAASWLTALGYPEVGREVVPAKLGYVSRLYHRQRAYDGRWKVLLVFPKLPEDRRLAVVSPVEDDLWLVTAGGWLGAFPDCDEASFLAFLKALPVDDAYRAVADARPAGDLKRFTMPGGLRRRFDLMDRWPERFLVMGDALCSFNPLYSQGMSVCAMTAERLDAGLDAYIHGAATTRDLQRSLADAVDQSWTKAKVGDDRFPELGPPASARSRFWNFYFDGMVRASATQRDVLVAMLRVSNLVAAEDILYRPGIASRSIVAGCRRLAEDRRAAAWRPS